MEIPEIAIQQSRRLKDKSIAAPTKNAHARFSGSSQRQGNCTKRSVGRCRQRGAAGESMSRTAETASAVNIHQTSRICVLFLAAKTTAAPVISMTTNATPEICQLKIEDGDGGSFDCVKTKLREKERWFESAAEICTHRCSQPAGKIKKAA